jgi:hypothetical protein
MLDLDGWSQDDAQAWWRDHGEGIVRTRRARTPGVVAPEDLAVLRTAAQV